MVTDVTLFDILRWNATREVRSMRTRNIRKMNKPYACREVVFTCSNGWRIERLPPMDYPVEGFFMGHCLGGRYGSGEWYNRIAFFSLREPDGTPHVTIYDNNCVGRADGRPRADYVALIQEWNPNAQAQGANPDVDTDYHEQGRLDDRDFRDMPGYGMYRTADWKRKRSVG